MSITLKTVQKIDDIFDTILESDSNCFFPTRLLSAPSAKQKAEEKLISYAPASKYSDPCKKSTSILNI